MMFPRVPRHMPIKLQIKFPVDNLWITCVWNVVIHIRELFHAVMHIESTSYPQGKRYLSTSYPH